MKYLLIALKVMISLSLLALVIGFVDVGQMLEHLRATDPLWIALSLVALLVQFLISMLRWREVSQALGNDLSPRDAVSLGFVGQLFNQVLPTNMGGDGVRVLALSKDGWGVIDAARSVVVDRIIGLLVILFAAAIALATLLAADHRQVPQGALLLSLLAGGLVAALVAIFWGSPWAQRVAARVPPAKPIAWILVSVRQVLVSARYTPGILLMAILVHLFLMQSFAFGALALGIPFSRALFAMMALIILASAFPLSFAGWGVREGAAATGLSLLGVDPSVAVLVSVFHGVGQIVIGLPGVLLTPDWLFRKQPAA